MHFPRVLAYSFLPICQFVHVIVCTTRNNNKTLLFISSKQVFVGDDALFEWKVNENIINSIAEIKFGFRTRESIHGQRSDAILVKEFRTGKIMWNRNRNHKRVQGFVYRTSVLENRTAAFRIRKVTLNDTSEFYCSVTKIGEAYTTTTDFVNVTVIDVEIQNSTSSQDVISWKGHRVHLHCNVRVKPNTKLSFIWRNIAKGGEKINPANHKDHVTSSRLTVRTLTDEEFGPYECVAMTPATNHSRKIRLKRLYEPSAPNNFSHDRKLTNNKNCSVVVQLSWMPPLQDGGALVTKYIVESKPFGQSWDKANAYHVTSQSIDICRPDDHGRDGLRVRVKAKNKVGVGKPSPATIVTFWDEPTAPQDIRTHLVRSLGDPFIKLSWGYPRDDGGVPVSAYLIRHKPVGSPWTAAALSETREQETTIWKTSRNLYEYEVRICAMNGVGIGEWSHAINAAFAEVPTRPLEVADKVLPHARPTIPHIHIYWNRPIDDGGLRITQYKLEYKPVSQKHWKTATRIFTKDEDYIIQNVYEHEQYKVRVAAQNAMGTGSWSNVATVTYREKPFVAYKVRSHSTRQTMDRCQVVLYTILALLLKSVL